MEKVEFIAKMTKRIDAKSDVIEQIVDATLAEVLAPAVFALPSDRFGLLAHNNCDNNCAAELARQQPGRGF